MIARKKGISVQLNQSIEEIRFSSSQRLEIQAVEIVDLDHLDTEALVDAIHHHNVGGVILTFSASNWISFPGSAHSPQNDSGSSGRCRKKITDPPHEPNCRVHRTF